ncbi:MAG: SDR family NAD(P)-dependent oxidoreductase [Microcella sp.]|uniref:SDR family NAD(P)-dependent oxidoreductase n=1 Tax=Microcella sp. TaxID=1913979 RepID=UPI003315CA9B
MTSLQGSSILILGATGGLGRHLARQLADAGAQLTLSARSMTDLEALGIPGQLVPADLTDPAAARTLVATAVTTHGRLDGVVNAAGAVAFGAVADTSDETIEALWEINALAPMRMLRAAIPSLRDSADEGRAPFVLTLSGVVSEHPTNGIGAYSAVKSALAAYVQVAAREVRKSGIRVIDARPGHTETALSRHPIAGETPKFPTGLEPAAVAQRIIAAIVGDERDLPSSAFSDVPAATSQMVPTDEAETSTGAHPAVTMAAQMPLEAAESAPVGSAVGSAPAPAAD